MAASRADAAVGVLIFLAAASSAVARRMVSVLSLPSGILLRQRSTMRPPDDDVANVMRTNSPSRAYETTSALKSKLDVPRREKTWSMIFSTLSPLEVGPTIIVLE